MCLRGSTWGTCQTWLVELAEMSYELNDEQQVHAVIRSLPNIWGHIKMVPSRTKYILTFQDIRWWLELEEEGQEAVEMTNAEVHMSTSNSRNGSKRKDQGNWIGKIQSNEETEHD